MRRPWVLLLLAASLTHSTHGHARTFTHCQLSLELLRYNFPRHLIPTWACVVEHASGRTTEKVTNHNNGYSSYGLFQINSKDWCKKGRKGGHCNMKCEDFLNVNLADDVRCTKRIYDRVGFKAWPTSYAYCKEKNLPSFTSCF